MDQLKANLAAYGTVYFAHTQTAGKGQRGKRWITEPGMQLAMTVVLDCSYLSLSQKFSLSVMAALATHDFFSKYAGEETRIKWPNDLYWRDRKAGGILIENQVRGSVWQASIVGIGINLNQVHFPGSLPNPVSLKQITGIDFNPVAMAKELCENLETRYQEVKAGNYKEQLAQYNELLFKKGQEVKLKKDNIVFNCVITGVSETGELLVSGGLLDSFRFGEVEWVLEW